MFRRTSGRPALMAAALLVACATMGHARVVAVVVGIDRYDSPDITQLAAAVKDARSFAEALRTASGAVEEDVKILASDDDVFAKRPTKANILLNLKWAQRASAAEDTFILYYAGHGITRWGKSYILPMDANTTDADVAALTSLSLDDLQNLLGGVKCSHQVIILDCCRNDPERGRGTEDNAATAEFVRDVQVVGRAGHEQAGAQSSSVLFSCSEGERAFERTDATNGIFTSYLIEGLKGGAARGGEVTFADLCAYVEARVPQYIRSEPSFRQDIKQTPWHKSEGTGQPTLARVGQPAVQPPVTQPPVAPAGTTGTLEVRGAPTGATVYVEGQPKGTLPCQIEVDLGGLDEKRVDVSLEMDGYKPAGGSITLRRGATSTWQTELQLALPVAGPAPLPPAGGDVTQPAGGEPPPGGDNPPANAGEPPAVDDEPPIGMGTLSPDQLEGVSEGGLQAYQNGLTALNQQDFASAATAFSEAIQSDPKWAQAYYARGVARIYDGDNEQAIEDLGTALDLRPDWADAYNDRGMAYADSEMWDAALADFEHAIALDPNRASAYLGRGFTYAEMGNTDQARQDLLKVMELDPNGLGATAAQALTQMDSGQGTSPTEVAPDPNAEGGIDEGDFVPWEGDGDGGGKGVVLSHPTAERLLG